MASGAGQFGTPLDQDYDYSPFYRSMRREGAQQSAFNNPSTANPWSSQTVNPDGSSSTNFTGQFGQLNDSLTSQAANNAGQPFTFGQFGVSDGSAAGQQASQAAFGQMKSRLDPMWQKSEHDMRRNAFQSGMGDGAAMDQSVGQFGRARNDAYSSAMGDALRQGMSAQQSAFGGNMAARQQNDNNQYQQAMQPWDELGRMQGFLGQPEYNQSNAGMVAAAQANSHADASAVQSEEQKLRQKILGGLVQYSDADRERINNMSLENLRGFHQEASPVGEGLFREQWEKDRAGWRKLFGQQVNVVGQ